MERRDEAVNTSCDVDSPKLKPLSLLNDYGIFLSMTNGLKDGGFRRSGVGGIHTVCHLPLHQVVTEPEKLP